MTKKQIINIVIAIVLGLYLMYLIIDSIDSIKDRENSKKEWTIERIREERRLSELDVYNQTPEYKVVPEIVAKFCDCTIDTIVQHYNYMEYKQISKAPYEQQIKIIEPVLSKCVDSFIEDLNNSPIWDSLRIRKNVNSCVERALKTGNGKIDSAQAYEYCDCFLTYLEAKYGRIGTINMDSILSVEKEKREECLEKIIQ